MNARLALTGLGYFLAACVLTAVAVVVIVVQALIIGSADDE